MCYHYTFLYNLFSVSDYNVRERTAIRPTNTPEKFAFFTGGEKNLDYAEICSSDDMIKEFIRIGTGGRTDIKIEKVVWKSPYRRVSLVFMTALPRVDLLYAKQG